jgi:hypothetical protein
MSDELDRDALRESLRWRWQEFGFRTPEDFEARHRESWFERGRDHEIWLDEHGNQRGIRRRVRDDDNEVEVSDDTSEALAQLVVGRAHRRLREGAPLRRRLGLCGEQCDGHAG